MYTVWAQGWLHLGQAAGGWGVAGEVKQGDMRQHHTIQRNPQEVRRCEGP